MKFFGYIKQVWYPTKKHHHSYSIIKSYMWHIQILLQDPTRSMQNIVTNKDSRSPQKRFRKLKNHFQISIFQQCKWNKRSTTSNPTCQALSSKVARKSPIWLHINRPTRTLADYNKFTDQTKDMQNRRNVL